MERIVVGRSATMTRTFTFTPTGSPTVAVTRSDGTTVTVGSVSGAGTDWSYTIPASSNTQLDTLKETWTATTGGSAQTFVDYIEVAGGAFFSLDEFRGLGSAYANTTNYPDKTVAHMRTAVEQVLEDACGVAFVPRFYPDARAIGTRDAYVNGTGGRFMPLRWARIRAIRAVTVDGVALTSPELATLVPFDDIGIDYPSRWTAGFGNVSIHYEHGKSVPDEWIKTGALALLKRTITPSGVDDRAINVTTDSGTYALFQAAVRGHMFDLPFVQSAVDMYNLNVGVA